MFQGESALTLLILWKPYMFSCLTKLENCSRPSEHAIAEADENGVNQPELALTLLCLKWDPRIVLLNSETLETTKLVPSSVQLINWADFGSIIILGQDAQKPRSLPERKIAYW